MHALHSTARTLHFVLHVVALMHESLWQAPSRGLATLVQASASSICKQAKCLTDMLRYYVTPIKFVSLSSPRQTEALLNWTADLLPEAPAFVILALWIGAHNNRETSRGQQLLLWQCSGNSQQGHPKHTHFALQIQPSGKRFKLEEEKQKVKVEDGQIQEIVVSSRLSLPDISRPISRDWPSLDGVSLQHLMISQDAHPTHSTFVPCCPELRSLACSALTTGNCKVFAQPIKPQDTLCCQRSFGGLCRHLAYIRCSGQQQKWPGVSMSWSCSIDLMKH